MAGISGYKEKYLAALDEQEKLERKHALQLDLLRKTIVHLSVAAKGQESKLDASLIALQNKMRGGSGADVFEQMERVQRAVGEFDREREQELQRVLDWFKSAVDNLMELSVPADLRSQLSLYKKGLKSQLTSYRAFGEAVNELSALQKRALAAAANPNKGLWQRIKGGKTLEDNAPAKPNSTSTEPAEAPLERDLEPKESVSPVTKAPPITQVDDPAAEDSYPKVAQRINATLKALVTSIEPNDMVRRKVEIVRDRIDRGMDWFALAVTLEDIRDILMARYLAADKAFSEYLLNINRELVSISEALGVAEDAEQQRGGAAEALTASVSKSVKQLQADVAKSNSLPDLQSTVSDHIRTIQNALSTFKQAQPAPSQSLSAQLKALMDRVKTVEEESEKSRAQLEEQRYKATHDPLTSLPNREAYNERAFHELHRFKRYGHPLTLAVCDLDHFKKINDTFGHQAGDKVLKLVAQVVSTRLRNVDFVARYGGEEFVLVMPETDAEQAKTVLDKMRAAIAKTPFRFKDSPVTITMSFGIVQFRGEDSVESAFARADKALYEAKANGRNQCVIAP
ncbi:GGDEF domain-containing protein [Saccharophagus degradans]|uniref:diguanylate cyclase n=1 Tax=Saccharophagus degradans TaxID=86304 RepID=A0AAW7X5T9_9GAMM|nr:GGDEF domain-containing protein [Saccharophagus degradans]MBU2986757.1 GGDEF domain-containing protein [Saccharophagus degradans]MDO6422754.1 GGDEF domain-containing protein [Saccharophagus degradans]MDO6606227.1 GGDEF domain-containing protein [Saccharophagus degradans]